MQSFCLLGTSSQEPEPSVSVVSEVQPGPPVKLQCSVLSHSGNEICQDGPKVSWFRTGPESVHPSFVYTHDECKKTKDKSTQKCVHTFSKNVNSSDARTYLCAVVTCGRIFMGTPIKVNNTQDSSSCDSNNYLFFVLSASLVLNFIFSAFLIKKSRNKIIFCCKAGPQTLDETFSHVQQVKGKRRGLFCLFHADHRLQENWQSEADKYEGSRGIQHHVQVLTTFPLRLLDLDKDMLNVEHQILDIPSQPKKNKKHLFCKLVTQRKVIRRSTTGTFLQVTEPEPFVSVVSEVQPGPPVKLQCSVLSHSGNEICQDGPKVSWFRTGPESVHPSFVYTHDECKKIKDKSTQKCVHTFSKNLNSSDAGTYLCAVVTCGRIFMGTPIKVNNTQDSSSCDSNNYLFFVSSASLVLNFLLSAFLIKKCRNKISFCRKAGPQTLDEMFSHVQQRDEDSLVYSMPSSPGKLTRRGRQIRGQQKNSARTLTCVIMTQSSPHKIKNVF
nr:uncharacterized protein LOC133616924 [Nerophis lumbriciformis]